MTVRYTDTALGEINEVSVAIEDTVALIQGQPRMAHVVYRGMVRAFPVGDHPYRIFYQVKPAEIVIRNVRHTRRQRPWEGE